MELRLASRQGSIMARIRLSRERIIDAALSLIDAEGLDAVSMRTLAARLDVQAMSLYHHVANKAALFDGLHERLLLGMQVEVEGLGWEDALRQLARAYRAIAIAHPRAFGLLATRPLSTPQEVAHIAPALAVLGAAGLSAAEQLFVVNLFFSSLNGLLLAEVAPIPGHEDVSEPDVVAAFAATTDTHPEVGSLGDLIAEITATSGDRSYLASRFADYVEVLVAGLRQHLRR